MLEMPNNSSELGSSDLISRASKSPPDLLPKQRMYMYLRTYFYTIISPT